MMLQFLVLVLIGFILYVFIASVWPHRKDVQISNEHLSEIQNRKFTRDTIGNDRASIIYDGTDALNLRMALLEKATTSLDIVMYKIVDSESTQAFLGEVYQAAERGVHVNVLINGLTYLAYRNRSVYRAINAHPNITCRIYNPVNVFQPKHLQFLMHDKLILVDDKYVIVGGRNIDERHFQPKGFEKAAAHDLEAFVVNTKEKSNDDVIYEVNEYLEKLYRAEWTIEEKEKKDLSVIAELLSSATNYKNSNPQFYAKSLKQFIEETVPTNKVSLIHNPVYPAKKEPILGEQLLVLAERAQESVKIQTPYIIGNNIILEKLKKMTQHIDVRILTNSLASSPNPFAYPNYYGYRRRIVNTGVEIYAFQNEDSLHNKSWMFDQRLLAVGTFNLDARSLFINSEIMLVIDSTELTESYSKQVGRVKSEALKVGSNNNYIKNSSTKPLKVPLTKRTITWISFNLLKAIQFLL